MKKLILIIGIMLMGGIFGCRKDSSGTEMSDAPDSLEMLLSAVAPVRLPLEVSADLRIDSVGLSVADSLLSLWITLDDDLIDSASVTSDRKVQTTILGMLGEAAALDSMLSLSRHAGVGLRIAVDGRSSRPGLSFMIPAGEWRVMSIDRPQVRDIDEIKVRNRVSSDNRDCPYEIEDGVVLLSMSVMDRYVTFRTEIDVEKLDFMVMKENRDSLSHGVVAFLRQQLDDSLQRKSLLDISDARFGYRNRYVASDRKDSFDISFTPDDLHRLIQTTDSVRSLKTARK